MSPNPERSEPDVNTTEHSPGDAEVIDINLKIASQFAREIRKKSYTNLSGEVLAEKLGLLLDADRPGKNTLQGKLIRLIDTGGNNLDDDTFYDEKIRRDTPIQTRTPYNQPAGIHARYVAEQNQRRRALV